MLPIHEPHRYGGFPGPRFFPPELLGEKFSPAIWNVGGTACSGMVNDFMGAKNVIGQAAVVPERSLRPQKSLIQPIRQHAKNGGAAVGRKSPRAARHSPEYAFGGLHDAMRNVVASR